MVVVASGAKSTCDRYFSRLVRLRGSCQLCGSAKNLECAHILRRRHVGDPDGTPLRHNTENAWCLCSTCHRDVDTDAVRFTMLVDHTIGRERYEALVRVKNAPHRRWTEKDWARERARLLGLLKAAGSTDREW